MSTVLEPRCTLDEYVARELIAPYKSEYFQGRVFAMSGGTPQHNIIGGSIFGNLYGRLRGAPCQPHNCDQRIRIPANGLSTYPDLSIVCGELEFDDQDHNAVTNPRVVFEVLSKSTEGYDRGQKFALYRQLESLQEYILVSQDEPLVERFVRLENGSWNLTACQGLESVLELAAVDCVLPLSEIYERVTFDRKERMTSDNR